MKRRLVHLAPGDHFVGDARHRVRTLLGSCVSITLWHARSRIGAMSHFLLADRPENRADRRKAPLDARYGTEALLLMLQDLGRRGIEPRDCEAKVFGGAHMFPGWFDMRQQVGQRNGHAALQLLQEFGIELVSSCLYGYGHRVILFDIASGDVWARQAKMASTPPGWIHPSQLEEA
ncbi:chemotaxis protein CheD [Roseateles sp.]|uniref:chemotaxis protein CheD n=1 Tax=Roseateles sp. TaxID=1971397 RepID=UPI0039EB84C1